MTDVETHFRTCNICEAMCGIAIRHRGDEILSIRGDADDPFSHGHICPKAVALQDFHNDPDRLRTPLRRRGGDWEEVSWDEALDEAADRLAAVQRKHGRDAVATYLGNPNAHNVGSTLFIPDFLRALGTRNRYSATSVDQLPHHVAARAMLGHGMLLPVPDIDRTAFMLILGANPWVSNGSMMTSAGFPRRMRAIQERGGKVVVVDPRRTETARKADEHFFIRPESDALLLAALIHTVFDEGLEDPGHLRPVIDGLDTVRDALAGFSPESVGSRVGIDAPGIRRLAREMAASASAVCYSRMGTCTQSFGGLCQWLTNVLNIVTGNVDRPGGAMFTRPAFDLVGMNGGKKKSDSNPRFHSRVRRLPWINNEFPVATLADEILTPGDGQVRALVCVAGNPVLSTPHGARLDEALKSLDFMLSLDIYVNETSRRANLILPAAMGLELGHYDLVFHILAVRNTARYSPPLFPPGDEQRTDWQILRALTARLQGKPEPGTSPETLIDQALRAGPYGSDGMSLKRLLEAPHGIDLGPLQPCLPDRLQTSDGRLKLAPDLFLADLNRLHNHAPAADPEYPFLLIGRRLPRSHNTWTKNAHRLVKGKPQCTLLMHPNDARHCGVSPGIDVSLSSRHGEVALPVEISDEVMPGVVSMPQGWGHNRPGNQTRVADSHPGVSINELTDPMRIDALTGNAALNGTPVRVVPLGIDL